MRRNPATLTWVAIGVCATAIGGVAMLAWPFTVDDAYIVAGYARSLHEHGRYSLDGTLVSDGVTGPLWVVPFLLAHKLGLSPLVVAKSVGLGCVLLAVVSVLLRIRARHGSLPLTLSAGVLCACQSDLAIWSVGGLETGLVTLLVTTSALSVTRTRLRTADHATLGVAVAWMAWLRPETAPVAAVWLACAWSRDRRGAWVAIGLATLGALSVLVFRYVMFGHVLPLSALAKPAELGHGTHYVLTALPLVTGGLGVLLFGRGMVAGRATDRWVGLGVMAHVIAVLLAGGDWMPGFRLLVPIVPLYAWVAAVGAVRWRSRRVGSSLVVASAALPLLSLFVQVPEARASSHERQHEGTQLAQWLQVHACRVALVDVGYLVYAARVNAIDLAGVTDEVIARLPGGHVDKRISAEALLAREPDTLILRGTRTLPIDAGLPTSVQWHSRTEHRLAESPAILARFRPVKVVRYSPGYVYYVLQDARAQGCSSR